MDKNRHQELIRCNVENKSAMYFNKGIDDMRTQNQYYSHQDALGNNNSRTCPSISNDIACTACSNVGAAEENWKSELTPRVDFYNVTNTRDKVSHSPIYIHEGRSLYQHRSSNCISDFKSSNKTNNAPPEAQNISNKMCTLEANYNMKHQQHLHMKTQLQNTQSDLNIYTLPSQPDQQQQHMGTIGVYCKDHSYEDKYESKQELYVDIKTGYSSTASSSASGSYNEMIRKKATFERIRNINVDQTIVNPSNIMTTQEQTSPNYGRKCPQIFTNEEQNVPHQSLYMSTPQFSSDKFSNISVQKKNLNEPEYQHRELFNPHSFVHLNSEQSKLKEMQLSTSVISSFPARVNKYSNNHMNELPVKQQIAQHQETTATESTHPQGHINYYIPSAKAHSSSSEISPITVRQATTQQYSGNHIALPSSQSPPNRPITSTVREFVDYMRKEDNVYNGLYAAPYNTPSPINSCCKEISTPCAVTNAIEGSPQIYKFGKVKKETSTPNKLCIENQNTPPSKSTEFKARTYLFENRDIKHENSGNDTKISTVAASASPSPSTSHTQAYHNNFTFPPHTYSQYLQPYHQQTDTNRTTVRVPHESATVLSQRMTYERQQPSSKNSCLNNSKSQDISHCPQPTQKIHHRPSTIPLLKKTHVAKPNYRELINQVYAMRTATSEEELNRQIIKKALNSASAVSVLENLSVPAVDNFHQKTAVQNNSLESYRVDSVHTSVNKIPKPSASMSTDKRMIKAEELSTSPLDLSMRTIKTKADSTEYRYQSLSKNVHIDYKHALPRVDFTPNFSLHVEDRNIPIKATIRPLSDQLFTATADLKSVSDIGCGNNDDTKKQPQSNLTHIKNYSHDSEALVGITIQSTAFSSNLKSQPSIPPHRNLKTSVNQGNKINQMRPSVLETNPFATIKANKCEDVNKNIMAVGQRPQDTSIIALSKPPIITTEESIGSGVIKNVGQIVSATPFASSSTSYDRDPKYFGRKRHLQEYSKSQCSEPVIKQTRYTSPSSVSKYFPSSETTVITVNKQVLEMDRLKTAEKCIQAEIPICCSQNNSTALISTNSMHICKSELITPTIGMQPLQFAPIKTETSTLISARIRTKAELKGFTFQSPVENKNDFSEDIKVKEEPSHEVNVGLLFDPVTEKYSPGDFIDNSWNNTCSEFLEQLITNSKRKPNKRKLENIKTENSQDLLPISTAPLNKDLINADRERYLSNVDSAETSISFDQAETYDSAFTEKSLPHEVAYPQSIIVQKKINKQGREKLRLQQEKRLAARLKNESSSESNDEMNKRKCERPKKVLRKLKNRQCILIGKTRFSDCGSDSSSDIEENILPTNKKQANENKKYGLKAKIESNDLWQCVKDHVNATKHIKISVTKSTEKTDSLKSENKYKCNPNQKSEMYKAGDNSSNKKKTERNIASKKEKTFIKEGLNTMTRSKRKQEMELQLANSKVLRNDKIIRNSTTKIKRKYVRKFVSNQNQLTNCKELSDNEIDRTLSMRLRSKKIANKNEKISTNKKSIKNSINKDEVQKSKGKGNERQSDLYLEVYRYKRSLKVPPSLITIEHPHSMKMAASLPNLEHDQDTTLFSNKNTKLVKSVDKLLQKPPSINKKSFLAAQTKQPHISEEPRSIIDVLHSRVLNSNAPLKPKCKKNALSNPTSIQLYNEASHNTESNCTTELLPSLKREIDEESCDGKKRHFSIFETKVLKTKTRTESKLQQRREIIREIFVGDDRPASAPPEISQISDGSEKMTFEQKYEQFLQQLNIVINEDKLRRYEKGLQPFLVSASVSDPAGTSTIEAAKNDEQIIDRDSRRNKCPISSLRRRRPGKYLRRKGSSGFDYIRKKKKPSTTMSLINAAHNIQLSVKAINAEKCNEQKVKTESDVCREIQKWVLNKSVGQSTMHKAARLGYIDVIVYCLDRIGMNPDQKDNAGYTPLHEACTKGWLEIARVLLQYGANHSEAAHSGIRPLHEASENDHEEIVRLLLSYGADPLLATYSGQTPLMLASSSSMRDLLNNYLSDVQNVGPDKKPWILKGPWEILDATNCGYDIFGGAPNFTCDMSRALRKSSVSNLISNKKQLVSFGEAGNCKKSIMEQCAVVLDNIDRFNSLRLYNDKSEFLVENSDSEGEVFEFEEADVLLPPLYLLKDEGSEKWVLLNDLCNLLKVKSKDTLLNKIYPHSSSVSSTHKNHMRELKMSDFLEKATCLQLLCAGEKINICASKVVLIKYNDSVRNLLGVKTILMKF